MSDTNQTPTLPVERCARGETPTNAPGAEPVDFVDGARSHRGARARARPRLAGPDPVGIHTDRRTDDTSRPHVGEPDAVEDVAARLAAVLAEAIALERSIAASAPGRGAARMVHLLSAEYSIRRAFGIRQAEGWVGRADRVTSGVEVTERNELVG